MKLFRVYTYTAGDSAITERIVAANTPEAAEGFAVNNVKAQNPTKGLTTVASAQANTTVLAVREAGSDGVLCVGRIPVNAVEEIAAALNPSIKEYKELLDHADDILRIADLPKGSMLAEAIKIIEAKLGVS